jgi:hypothetical protein
MSGSGNAVTADEVKAQVDDDVLAQAEEAGVDVDGVIEETVAQRSDYGAATVKRFVVSALNRQIEAASAETVKGLLCGSRDRHGKNWPRRHALIKSDGQHIEASTWDGSLPTPDGSEIDIPAGAAVEIGLEHDAEYDSYEAKQIHSVNQLSRADLSDRLTSVAKKPSDLRSGDEYSIVAVHGEIAFVNPQTVFADGEPQGDGPVMLEDERGQPKPHFEVVLDEDGDTRVRGHAEQQRYATPYFDLEDFDRLVRDAHSDFDTPENQAGFLNDALRGREVVLIGNVNSYDKNRSQGQTKKYVDVAVAGLIGVERDDQDGDTGVSEAHESPNADSVQKTDDGDGADSAGSGDKPETGSIEEVAGDVAQYASLVGMSKSDLSPEVLRENTEIDAPDSVLEAAIERLDGDDESGEPRDSGGQEVDDPIEACFNDEKGMYECPQEGCLFSASGQAGLFGHVTGDHVAGDQNPEEWIESVVGN